MIYKFSVLSFGSQSSVLSRQFSVVSFELFEAGAEGEGFGVGEGGEVGLASFG